MQSQTLCTIELYEILFLMFQANCNYLRMNDWQQSWLFSEILLLEWKVKNG